MKRWIAFVVFTFVTAVGIVVWGSAAKSSLTPSAPTAGVGVPTTQGLVVFTNKERQKAGLRSLVENPALDKSAQAKCNDMVTRGYYAHNDPEGREPWHFFIEQGIAKYQKLGENLSDNFPTSKEIVQAWIASEEHKSNILDARFTDVGFGICNFSQSSLRSGLVVQHFADL